MSIWSEWSKNKLCTAKIRKYIKIVFELYICEIFPFSLLSWIFAFLLWAGISLIVGTRRLILENCSSPYHHIGVYDSLKQSKTFKWYFKKMVFLFLIFFNPCSWWQFTICVQVRLRIAQGQHFFPHSAVVTLEFFCKFLLCCWLFLSVARKWNAFIILLIT